MKDGLTLANFDCMDAKDQLIQDRSMSSFQLEFIVEPCMIDFENDKIHRILVWVQFSELDLEYWRILRPLVDGTM